MSATESWELSVNVVCVVIFISLYIFVIDSSFMLCHEILIFSFHIIIFHLPSKLVDVILGSSLQFSSFLSVKHISLLHFLLNQLSEGIILKLLESLLLLLLKHLLPKSIKVLISDVLHFHKICLVHFAIFLLLFGESFHVSLFILFAEGNHILPCQKVT